MKVAKEEEMEQESTCSGWVCISVSDSTCQVLLHKAVSEFGLMCQKRLNVCEKTTNGANSAPSRL
jgi:hypothetical protein